MEDCNCEQALKLKEELKKSENWMRALAVWLNNAEKEKKELFEIIKTLKEKLKEKE